MSSNTNMREEHMKNVIEGLKADSSSVWRKKNTRKSLEMLVDIVLWQEERLREYASLEDTNGRCLVGIQHNMSDIRTDIRGLREDISFQREVISEECNRKVEMLEYFTSGLHDYEVTLRYGYGSEIKEAYLPHIKKEDVQVVKCDSEIIVLKIKDEYKILVKATGKLSDLNEESDK